MADFAIVHTETHDESKPAGTRARSLGDDDIREKDRAIRERLAVDHVAPADESGEDAVGIHKQVTMRASADDPTAYDDVGYLYLKVVSAVIELFYKDSEGNELQISSGGKILGDNVLLTNNTYLKAKDAAGTGEVNLIKADAAGKAVLAAGAEMASSDAPTTDAGIVTKASLASLVPAEISFAGSPLSASYTALAGNQGPTTTGHEYFYLTIGKNSSGVLCFTSGVAAVGTAVPLPAGCARADCQYIVAPKYFRLNGVAMHTFSVGVDASTGVVSIGVSGTNWVG